jgi:hypothetical protein
MVEGGNREGRSREGAAAGEEEEGEGNGIGGAAAAGELGFCLAAKLVRAGTRRQQVPELPFPFLACFCFCFCFGISIASPRLPYRIVAVASFLLSLSFYIFGFLLHIFGFLNVNYTSIWYNPLFCSGNP